MIAEVTESVTTTLVHKAILRARKTVQFNRVLADSIQELKDAAGGGLIVFAMSNISQPDYADVKS